MKRLLVYCEGQTEVMFVERLLRPHLHMHGVTVERPILAATSQTPFTQRGGFVNWAAIKFDLRQEFATDADPNLRFTTLLDVYAMPGQVLSLAGFAAPVTNVSDVETVEIAIAGVFNEPRFRVYLQRHELEALLLSDLDALKRVFHRHSVGIEQLRADISGFPSMEDVNHGPLTHPSARLNTAITGYQDLKASNAYFAIAEAGLPSVRAKCPRFDAWLREWETWGEAA